MKKNTDKHIPIEDIIELLPFLNESLDRYNLRLRVFNTLDREAPAPKQSTATKPMPAAKATPHFKSLAQERIYKAVQALNVGGAVDKTSVRKSVKMSPHSFGQNLRRLEELGLVVLEGQMIVLS